MSVCFGSLYSTLQHAKVVIQTTVCVCRFTDSPKATSVTQTQVVVSLDSSAYVGEICNAYVGEICRAYVGEICSAYIGEICRVYIGQICRAYVGHL